jgi:hypothetical protein
LRHVLRLMARRGSSDLVVVTPSRETPGGSLLSGHDALSEYDALPGREAWPDGGRADGIAPRK